MTIKDIEDLRQRVLSMVGPPLAPYVESLGEASLFNLYCGISAVRHDGPSGTLTLQIPAKKSDRIEIDWHATPRTTPA